ncbi:centromere protein S-like [Anoplophora glabripennis]|uniref:centromere protein S-like n=1 Tax=Anoplophora glabripennis TaxID=217634 RepID=UPI0008759E39|nr:centromere protein S-like [Anoplophora glabripennis]
MSTEQKIKQTIHNTSTKLAKEVAASHNMEIASDGIDLIAEMTYQKLLGYGIDLDAFQKHAKRSTITADDVKLLVRRNESLKQMVDSKLQAAGSLKPTPDNTTGAKRKRKAT